MTVLSPPLGPGPSGDRPTAREASALWSLVDRLPAMVSYWDTQVCNVAANAAYAAWFGTTPAAMRGRPLSDFLDAAALDRSGPFIAGVLRGDEQRFERTTLGPDGAERHSEVAYMPDLEDGVVTGFLVVVVDVTERVEAARQLQRSIDQHRALARHLPGCFVLPFDRGLRYTVAEGPALAGFGLTSEQLEGHTVREAFPDRADELEARYRGALAGEVSTWRRVVAGRTYELTAAPIRDGAGAVFAGLVLARNVTRELALRGIAAATAAAAPIDEVLELVSEGLQATFEADHVAVARFADGGIDLLAVLPPIPSITRSWSAMSDDDSAAAGVARSGAAQFVRYGAGSTGRAQEVRRSGLVVGAGAPIRVNGALWGAVAVGFRHADVDRDHLLEHLATFAAAAATSISSASAWEALSRLATTDDLTKLPNRKTLTDELDRAALAAARSGRPLSVVLFDIDHFKAVNDRHGHPTGDAVLAGTANRMAAASRRHEVLARFGGEEFVLLLPGATADDARGAAERLRAAVARAPIAGIPVTLSAGTCTDPDGRLGPSELLARADHALYAAKGAGRDTVRSAPEYR